jgi:hypothetical protein
MPSTLAPPTSVPISAAAAVVTIARNLVLSEPKLLTGDLTRDIADLSWSSPAPIQFTGTTRCIATAFPIDRSSVS